MRPRSHDAHVSKKDIEELRNFIQAGLSKDSSHRVNTRIACSGLLGSLIALISAHRPKLEDAEGQVAKTRPCLSIEQRTGRLNRLENFHHQAERRQNKQDHRETHQDVDRSLDDPIHRIFQRLIRRLIGEFVNQWAMDHTTTLAGGQPILALDMYEHSYHLDYGAQAAAYVDAFMAAINWPNVARMFARLPSAMTV